MTKGMCQADCYLQIAIEDSSTYNDMIELQADRRHSTKLE